MDQNYLLKNNNFQMPLLRPTPPAAAAAAAAAAHNTMTVIRSSAW